MNVYINIEDGKYDHIFDLHKKPERPTIGNLPTATYAREYADQLDAYQIAKKEWEDSLATYRAEIEQAHALFKADVIAYVFGKDAVQWASLIETIYEYNLPGALEDRSDLNVLVGRMERLRRYVDAAKVDLAKLLQLEVI